MKIAVFDANAKSRLLGHLHVDNYSFRDQYLRMPARMAYFKSTDPSDGPDDTLDLSFVEFAVATRSSSSSKWPDAITEEVLTVNRKVLETGADLTTLLEMDNFYLPDETNYEAVQRRRLQRLCR